MFILKKAIALAIIATFLASIPLALAESNPGPIRVVYELKIGHNYAKPPGTPGTKEEKSYTLIAQGLMTVPANIYYKSSSEDTGFATAIGKSINEYEYYTGDIFQNPISEANLVGGVRDEKNAMVFGDLGSTTIAVTYAWITRGRTKIIVEFDVIFNTYFEWGNAGSTSETNLGDTSVMDTWNIATHEMGHCVGLGDLYQSQNIPQTMYGYSTEGETYKRTLNDGDIAGLAVLYPK